MNKNKDEFDNFFSSLNSHHYRMNINSYDGWLMEMRELMMIRMCLEELCKLVGGNNPVENIEQIYNKIISR